jgi:hypothetical protein
MSFSIACAYALERKTPEALHVTAKSKFLQELVLSDEAGYGSPNQSLKEQGLHIDRGDCLAIMNGLQEICVSWQSQPFHAIRNQKWRPKQ